MKFCEMLRVIWINLMQNKFKVILTSLGIIVGAITIVLVIAIGRGGEAEIATQFGDLSAATVYVIPDDGKMMLSGKGRSELPRITMDDMDVIFAENPYLSSIMLINYFTTEAEIGSGTDYVNVAAVTPDYEIVSNLPVALGDNFSDGDIQDLNRVAVLGDKLAKKYFGTPESAIGNTLMIWNRTYKIIGVLARKGDGIQGMNPDSTMFLPYTTADEDAMNGRGTPQVIGLARDIRSVDKAMKRIKSTLDYLLEDSTMYTVEDAGSRMEAALGSARTMSMLLISVAIIVFIVGGIGIMNVLFLSVKERTKEIGILKALGSAKRDILLQFLLESMGISLFGGLTGILLSFVFLPLMRYTDIPVLASIDGQMLALFFSVMTGTLFGFYPAYKASRLIPIDALNYE